MRPLYWSLRPLEKSFRSGSTKLYFRLLNAGRILVGELTLKTAMPLSTRMRFLRKGFRTSSAELYRLNEENCRDYLPDSRWDRTMHINGICQGALHDKLLFYGLFADFEEFIPTTLALVQEGVVCSPESGGELREDDLLHLLADQTPFVLRPVVGMMGMGVFIVERGKEGLTVNGEPSSVAAVQAMMRGLDNYFLSARVKPHPRLAAMYPRTPHVTKILTMWDIDRREPFLAAAVQRVGTSASYPLDGWSRGALCSRVDLETGVLGAAVPFRPGNPADYDRHPDTGVEIAGLTLPNWESVKETLLAMCCRMPFIKYLVWDIVITGEGFEVLEGNSHPGLAMMQVHYPLLKDPRARAFYARHGVIDPSG